MVSDALDQALDAMSKRTDLFDEDEEKIRYFDIAVRNGYDTAGRRDEDSVVQALEQAAAALKPVEFPNPTPRALRAVGLTIGVVDEHLHAMHADKQFMTLLSKCISLSIKAVPQWPELADVFDASLNE